MSQKPNSSEPEYSLVFRSDTSLGFSPYRLVDCKGEEIGQVNEFLDAQAARGLSERSLRAYGYSLLHFWKWVIRNGKDLRDLLEEDLLEYIRAQGRDRDENKSRKVAPTTINHRLTAVRCLYRFHCGRDLPAGRRHLRARSHPYHSAVASKTGYLHPARPPIPHLRVKTPHRVVVPLRAEEIDRFLESLRTWRDLSIASLMFLCGLRSREVIELTLEGLSFSEEQIRIHGKGDKERVIPLPPQVAPLLRQYLEVERPRTQTEALFVCLKGKSRGEAMTVSGLRSLFRYHRKRAGVPKANPHRFRHSFGAEMVRAGISLPALMKLMGHANIQTTMLYVELSQSDVREEFQRVLDRIHRERTRPTGD
jgi:site-specific recombinase XerD